MLKTPTTHKQIRAIAYKKLDEVQALLEKLCQSKRASKEEIEAARILLLEARAQLALTMN